MKTRDTLTVYGDIEVGATLYVSYWHDGAFRKTLCEKISDSCAKLENGQFIPMLSTEMVVA